MAFNPKTFVTRTASAAVFVFVLLSCVWFHPISFVLFFTAVGFIGLYEYNKLAKKLGKQTATIANYLLHLLFITAIFFVNAFDLNGIPPILLGLILIGPIFLLVKLFSQKSFSFRDNDFLTPFVYVTLPCILLILMSHSDRAIRYSEVFVPQKVLGIIFLIWINDTGAYLVGSFLGKHKMYERISPGKTWEGTIGGVILCVAFSFIMVKMFPQLELQHWMVISAIVAIFGTLGDLVESMLKRVAGVKDSGSIMPGHGGVLDRFDSLIFSTPFVFAYLTVVGLL